MVRYGKFLIGGLGWALGGPLGALFGFFLGSMYDEMSKQEEQARTQAGDFGLALIALTAGVIKADKKVKQSELDYVRKFLAQQFPQDQTQQLMELLDKTLDQSFSVQEICQQIRKHMEYEERLHLLHYLYGIANADGHVDSREDSIIQQMAQTLHIKRADLTSIRSMFVKDRKAPYKVLEVDPSASNDEVKKAYRKMAKKYHPDKLSHLGKEHQKTAEEKFQKVNEAYEQIKKERGMK